MDLFFPHVVWHSTSFCVSATAKDKAKINFLHSLTVHDLNLHAYCNVSHFMTFLGLVDALSGTSHSVKEDTM